MIGYCLKDEGQAHFQTFVKAFSQEELQAGRNSYNVVSATYLLGKSKITKANATLLAWGFLHSELAGLSPAPGFRRILLWMINSGEFVPGPQWVTPGTGKVLDPGMIDIAWRIWSNPKTINMADIKVYSLLSI